MDEATLLKPTCSICGAGAAEIELTVTSGQWRLRYRGPGGGNGDGDVIAAGRARAILEAFAPPYQAARVKAAGFYDDAGFCAECGAFYCPTHWRLTPTGGGWCPAGHFKSFDPHWSPE